MEKNGTEWSVPIPLNDVINTDVGESVFGISRRGTLYFRRDLEFFSSMQKDGIFQAPEKIDIPSSAGMRTLALFIAPEEDYMILESLQSGDGYGGADLYAAFHQKDGSWSKPVNLGPKINSGGHERFPSITPDGKYLFFLRVSDGSDIFWVDAKIIGDLKLRENKNEN